MKELSKNDFFKITYIVTAFFGILVIGYFLNRIAYEQPYAYDYGKDIRSISEELNELNGYMKVLNDIRSISEELNELNRYMKVLCEEIEQTSFISSCR